MEFPEREFLVNKIIAGITICNIDDVYYLIRSPTVEQKYFAELVYQKTLKRAEFGKAYSDEQMKEWMILNGFWEKDDDEKMKKAEDSIEEFKVQIYQKFHSEDVDDLRKSIKVYKRLYKHLMEKKYAYSNLTCQGIAFATKQRYLIGSSIYLNNEPYWKNFNDWEKPDILLDSIINFSKSQEVSEEKIRELARTDPWSRIWAARSGCKGLLDKYATELTNEQSLLILYSRMYENVYESMERPPEAIINDDDALDGWRIVQRRKQEKEENKKKIEEKLGNLGNAKEVFIMVNDDNLTSEEQDKRLKTINDMNDMQARITKRAREKQVRDQGQVDIVNFIDIRMDALEQARNTKG